MEKRERISLVFMIFTVLIALFIDFIQAILELIPLLGTILARFISLFAWMSYSFLFMMKGVSLFKGKSLLKRLGLRGSGIIAETVLAAMPVLTFAVLVECLMIRHEDKIHNQESEKGIESSRKSRSAIRRTNRRRRALRAARAMQA